MVARLHEAEIPVNANTTANVQHQPRLRHGRPRHRLRRAARGGRRRRDHVPHPDGHGPAGRLHGDDPPLGRDRHPLLQGARLTADFTRRCGRRGGRRCGRRGCGRGVSSSWDRSGADRSGAGQSPAHPWRAGWCGPGSERRRRPSGQSRVVWSVPRSAQPSPVPRWSWGWSTGSWWASGAHHLHLRLRRGVVAAAGCDRGHTDADEREQRDHEYQREHAPASVRGRAGMLLAPAEGLRWRLGPHAEDGGIDDRALGCRRRVIGGARRRRDVGLRLGLEHPVGARVGRAARGSSAEGPSDDAAVAAMLSARRVELLRARPDQWDGRDRGSSSIPANQSMSALGAGSRAAEPASTTPRRTARRRDPRARRHASRQSWLLHSLTRCWAPERPQTSQSRTRRRRSRSPRANARARSLPTDGGRAPRRAAP